MPSCDFDNSYIMASVSMPIYWFLVMMPHMARAHKVVPSQGLTDVIAEPRKKWGEAAEDTQSADAAFVRRATGAHQNGWENFIVFTSAVLVSFVFRIDPKFFNVCCVLVLLCRLGYNITYLSVAKGTLSFVRSFFFIAQFGTCFALWIKACSSAV
eukprot:TRINITY_DN18702_c0_g2_i1.p2 TRINITY_DN18702_c0_g2~~TRINITY_DN18702_c0_g2_i1.p2  ORF type:complete len:155 (+),score=29.70 TRINITY_DN18702_c0_g2_i1:53-517(+)